MTVPSAPSGAAGAPDVPVASGTTGGPGAPTTADDQFMVDVFARDCGSRRTLETIAGKWGVLALAALHEGAYRFNALRRRVDGVSEKMLAQTLQGLERDGLVRRDVQASIPPHVEYSLTPFGARVAARLTGLIELVEGEMATVQAAQAAYDRAAKDRKR